MEWEDLARELSQQTDSKIVLLVMDGVGRLEVEVARRRVEGQACVLRAGRRVHVHQTRLQRLAHLAAEPAGVALELMFGERKRKRRTDAAP